MAGLLGALPQRRRSKSSRPSRTGMAAGALTRCADTLSISNMKTSRTLHAQSTTHWRLASKPDLYAHASFLTISKVYACEYRLHA